MNKISAQDGAIMKAYQWDCSRKYFQYNFFPVASSPDLSTCNYFLWDYLKSNVNIGRSHNICELKLGIRNVITAISHNRLFTMTQKCVRNASYHLWETIIWTR